jgi:hypothetical protein
MRISTGAPVRNRGHSAYQNPLPHECNSEGLVGGRRLADVVLGIVAGGLGGGLDGVDGLANVGRVLRDCDAALSGVGGVLGHGRHDADRLGYVMLDGGSVVHRRGGAAVWCRGRGLGGREMLGRGRLSAILGRLGDSDGSEGVHLGERREGSGCARCVPAVSAPSVIAGGGRHMHMHCGFLAVKIKA